MLINFRSNSKLTDSVSNCVAVRSISSTAFCPNTTPDFVTSKAAWSRSSRNRTTKYSWTCRSSGRRWALDLPLILSHLSWPSVTNIFACKRGKIIRCEWRTREPNVMWELKPWCSCYTRRLMFKRSWVRIPVPYTGWTCHFSSPLHMYIVNFTFSASRSPNSWRSSSA